MKTKTLDKIAATKQCEQLAISQLPTTQDFLSVIEEPRIRDLMTAVYVVTGIHPPDERPQWVFNAVSEFLEGSIRPPKSRKAQSDEYQAGYIFSFIGLTSPQPTGDEKRINHLVDSTEFLPKVLTAMAKAPGPEASDFYSGLADGKKLQDITSPSSSAIIYAIMAIKWRDVAVLKNTAAVHEWLDKMLGRNMTGSRDRIAKLCQRIKLPLVDKGGRPKGKPRKRSSI